MPNNLDSQRGFTLIELMIAITLGLIISAAALMIFLSSQRSLAIQAGMGDIQQNTIFGLSSLTHDLRHANLDTGFTHISNSANNTGIDFSKSNSTGTNGVMQQNSDRLTIRYHARKGHNTDCAGTANIADGTIITHEYYIAKLPKNQQSGGTDRYGLMCQSSATPNAIVVIPDAESFKVSLLTRNTRGTLVRTDDQLRYVKLSDYTSGNVTAIEVGVVIRSSNSVHADSKINHTTFTIAGQEVQLNTSPDNNRYLRTPITQVIALRNAQEL